MTDDIRRSTQTRTFVYVITTPSKDATKVGIAKNVMKRLRELQTSCGLSLEVVYTEEHNSKCYAEAVERQVLHVFKEHRMRGEWISLPPMSVIDEVRMISARMRLPASLTDGLRPLHEWPKHLRRRARSTIVRK